VVEKAALGQVFSEYFGFPCQSGYQFVHHHYHPGWYNRPIGGRSAEWTQLGSTPPLQKKLLRTSLIVLTDTIV
jgi:hypothetical protein